MSSEFALSSNGTYPHWVIVWVPVVRFGCYGKYRDTAIRQPQERQR